MRLATLSVCMIVRDEEPILERCLQSAVQFADELIVVDTGSRDFTVDIARKYTKKVYSFTWVDDFSMARNASYSYATSDYVMWLDADDVVLPEDIKKIQQLKQHGMEDADVVCMLYASKRGKQHSKEGYAILRDRIMRRSLNPRWHYPVHEAIPLLESYTILFRSDIIIYHCKEVVNETGRNLRIFEKQRKNGYQLNTFLQALYCREKYFAGQYEEAVAVYNAMKDNPECGQQETEYALGFYIEAMKRLKRHDELLKELSSLYDPVNPYEIIAYEIGRCHEVLGDLAAAWEWYLRTIQLPVNYEDGRLHVFSYHDFLPYQRLCKLCITKGDIANAYTWHCLAKEILPDNLSVKISERYFQKRGYSGTPVATSPVFPDNFIHGKFAYSAG